MQWILQFIIHILYTCYSCVSCLANERQSDRLLTWYLYSFMLQVKQVSFSVTPMIRLHRRLCQQLVLISKWKQCFVMTNESNCKFGWVAFLLSWLQHLNTMSIAIVLYLPDLQDTAGQERYRTITTAYYRLV